MESLRPLVSVCIPTYNEERRIYRCLEELTKQTMNNQMEVVLADYDAKTLEEVVRFVEDTHAVNIHYVRSDKKGIGYQRNLAIRNSDGLYIVNMDADSRFSEPRDIARLVTPLRSGHYLMTVCDTYYDEQNSLTSLVSNIMNICAETGLVGHENGMTFSRSLFDDLGGFPLGIGEGTIFQAQFIIKFGEARRLFVKNVKVLSSARRMNKLVTDPASVFNYNVNIDG